MKKYRIIIAGGRDYEDYENVKHNVCHMTKDIEQEEIEVVSGGCDIPGKLTFTRDDGREVYGADGLGERLAKEKGWSVKTFDPDWVKFGKAAGPIRNTEMAQYATHGLCFWDRKSKGTKSMINLCEKYELIGSVVFVE